MMKQPISKYEIKCGANLIGADLTGVDLTWANLPKANLTGVLLTHASLFGVNLIEANLTRIKLKGTFVRPERCLDLYVGGYDSTGVIRVRCGGWKNSSLNKVAHIGASMAGADLTGANLTGVNLYEANLYRANLTGVDLSGANFTPANLTGVDLTWWPGPRGSLGWKLPWDLMQYTDLTNAIMPDGNKYIKNQSLSFQGLHLIK